MNIKTRILFYRRVHFCQETHWDIRQVSVTDFSSILAVGVTVINYSKTLIASQGPAFFLSAQVAGNSGWRLCICLTPVALSNDHKLCRATVS